MGTSPRRSVENLGKSGEFSIRDFSSIKEIGECSTQGGSTEGKGSNVNRQVVHPPICEKDFISYGMFSLAKSEDQEWRRRQAVEVREMLFRSPQPCQMREVIKQMDVEVREVPSDIHELEIASLNLEDLLRKMKSLMKKPAEQETTTNSGGKADLAPDRPDGPDEPNGVQLTHEAIHRHSRVTPHPAWVWITKKFHS
jgi:hypothetical protein